MASKQAGADLDHRHGHVEGHAAARGRARIWRRSRDRREHRGSAGPRDGGHRRTRRRRRPRLHGRSAGTAPTLLGIEAAKRRGGTMVVQGEGNQMFPDFPIGRLTRKGMTLKSARGHSYRAVELALHTLASHRVPARADDHAQVRAGRGGLRHQVCRRSGRGRRHSRVGDALGVTRYRSESRRQATAGRSHQDARAG